MTVGQFIRFLNTHENTSTTELRRLLVGKPIGTGCSRAVFECKLHDCFVVKIQYVNGFHNAIEYEVWEAIGPAYWWSRWLAASVFISKNGRLLIQEKVDMKQPAKKYPKKIPRFFTDIKYDNYGFVGKQLKCVDYGNVLAMLTGFLDKKYRRANW